MNFTKPLLAAGAAASLELAACDAPAPAHECGEGVHFETEKIWHQFYSNAVYADGQDASREDTECAKDQQIYKRDCQAKNGSNS